jgi:hypothetical protein
MPDFGPWLRARTEPELQELKAFAETQGANWPYESNSLQPYIDRVNAALTAGQLQQNNATALLAALGQASERWKNLRARERRWSWPTAGGLALFTFGVAAALFVYYGVSNTTFIQTMERTEGARGLITFFFSFTTMAVVLLVVISTFWIDAAEVEARFSKAKDVLTVLIGVLGTIMGFYFGTAADGRFTIANLTLAPVVASSGETVNLAVKILGGTGPYQYTIAFNDGSPPISERTDSASFTKAFKAPAAKEPTSVTVTVAITDARGNQAHSATILTVRPAAAPAAGAGVGASGGSAGEAGSPPAPTTPAP